MAKDSRALHTHYKITGGDSGVDPCLPYFNNRVGRGRLCPPHYYSPLEFSDLPTALLATYYTAAQVNFHIRSFPEEQQFSFMTRGGCRLLQSTLHDDSVDTFFTNKEILGNLFFNKA